MGLAGPRKSTKIGNDPNNTKWTRSTTGFGHRIMSSQGWTPGSLLGAKDAAHANLLTAASASHIKVILKDDNLGLGARIGRETEPTGLDAFKGLLGRLNGKTETELKKDEQKRDDVRLARYAALKFPEVRFVSAGLLTQEKEIEIPQPTPKDETPKKFKSDKKERTKPTEDDETYSSESDAPARKSKSKSKSKSKKSRSRDEPDGNEQSSESKKKKKSKKRKADSESESSGKTSEPEVKVAATISRERRPMGRNVTRSRHIAQKKRAIMDEKSLNEIFMIKA
ncbi:uncharacterized protein N7479_001058 [Penicillium vulpinum]|uniref:Protein PXR1 n=1 Tax=Penicillium vulpinum TaxID=29845 RepID=A0A1V6RE82_9EURO|nr:uncharacterized protein N7479_001058 [Penicillium vulpinum]KAJ5971140.1 hypothetical protein N7479_001058 [Penicillium vulpinum]OQE00107.1 hypothetical protein PENVUL_c058G06145 [Penicillium vulpinum]